MRFYCRSPAQGNAGRRSGSDQRGAGLEGGELRGVWRRILTLLSSGGEGSLSFPSDRLLMLKSKVGTPGSHFKERTKLLKGLLQD